MGPKLIYLPASEDGQMKYVRLVVVDGKVNIFFEASQVNEKCDVFVVNRLKELKLSQRCIKVRWACALPQVGSNLPGSRSV